MKNKNKKPIIRMNGKKTKPNQEDAVAKFSHDQSNQEQAATIEDANDPIPTFARKPENMDPVNKSKKWRSLKPIVIAVVAAIITGSVLGFIMLNMFGSIEDDLGKNGNEVATTGAASNDDGNKDSNASESQKSVDAFVTQGGVFSEKENADQWAKTFKQAGFPAIIWERESQYYLLTGIASTEEQAKQLATSMKEQELDVFAKEWPTSDFEVEFTEKEIAWLGDFQAQWEDTLESVSKQEEISAKDWENLVEKQPQDSEKLSDLVEKVTALLTDMEQADEMEAQNLLLTILQQYDDLLT